MSRYYRSILNVQGAAIDPDAQAFLTATGIVDATITSAINNLVLGLKGASLWAKMKAIYPFVGGTATTHKFNLKDPRDLDAAFRITWFGGVTHSANGVQGNGTNGYGNTHVNNATLPQNGMGLFYYSRTNQTRSEVDMGVTEGTLPFRGSIICPRYLATGTAIYRAQGELITPAIKPRSDAFHGVFRVNSTTIKTVDATTINNGTNISATPVSLDTWILAHNGTVPSPLYSSKQFALIGIAQDSLTDADIINLRSSINTFQTALSRNV